MTSNSRRGALLVPPKTDAGVGTEDAVADGNDLPRTNEAEPTGALDVEFASPVELAVVWVEKARKGSIQWFDAVPESQMRMYRLRKRVKSIVHVVMILYLCLAFVEQPSWCLGDAVPCANLFQDMPSSNLPVAPFQLTNSLEILFLMVLACRTWLRWRSLAGHFSATGWNMCLIVLLVFAFIDCAVAIFNIKGIIPGDFRLARLCRPLIFLCCYKHLRETVARVAQSIPQFFNVLASLALCVFLFTWVGVVLFAGTDEGAQHFRSWEESTASMWILFTTANNPDVWLPAYDNSRWSFLFVFAYLILSLYLLNNILLAAVYDGYKEKLKKSLKTFYENKEISIGKAFDLLTEGAPMIDEEKWSVFFALYCDGRYGGVSARFSARDHLSNRERARQAFQFLDEDGNGGLSKNEFKSIIDIIHDHNFYVPRTDTSSRRSLHYMITRGVNIYGCMVSWDSLVDVLIFVDIALTFASTLIFIKQVSPENSDFSSTVWNYGGAWYWIQFCIACFYFIETNMKIIVLGPEQFWYLRPFRHRFDLFNVYCLSILEFVYMVGSPSPWIVRIYVLNRIARTTRLLRHVRSLRHLASIMNELVPTYRRLSCMLMIVFYIYATIGEQVFGGLIRKDNQGKLDGSDFDALGYWNLNFNDFLSGIVTLFVLMVVNNWFVISDGFFRVSGTAWSQVFFVSFFIVANLIVLNIFLALILDCFATLRDDLERSDEAVARIIDRGFTEEQALDGLAAKNGSWEEALRWLEDTRRHAAGGAGGNGLGEEASQRRPRPAHLTRESVLRRVLLTGEDLEELERRELNLGREGVPIDMSTARTPD